MITYQIGETFVHKGKIYTTCKEIRMCNGCHFFKFDGKTGVCVAPAKTDCFDKIFKIVKQQPKKNTLWRKIQAFMLWNKHFQNDHQTMYMRNLIYDTNYFNNI